MADHTVNTFGRLVIIDFSALSVKHDQSCSLNGIGKSYTGSCERQQR